jgi:hypothetical protein
MVRLAWIVALRALDQLEWLDVLLAAAVAPALAGYSLLGCCTHIYTYSLLYLAI